MKRILFAIVVSALIPWAVSCRQDDGWRDLLDPDLTAWRTYQSYALTDAYIPWNRPTDADGNEIPPIGYDVNLEDGFTVTELNGEKVLHISGKYYGCLFTKESFGNYHLRLKVKFGTDKFEPRKDRAMDSGIMYHSMGECGQDGWCTWMRAHEFQVIESGTREGSHGDYYNNLGTHMDIRSNPRMESPAWSMYEYNPSAPLQTIGKEGGGATCSGPDLTDTDEEWTKLELICFEDKALHIVDGKVKMALQHSAWWNGEKDVPLTEGRIQLQSEAAEVYYKDIQIRPIDALPAEYLSYFE
jgi:hypothetical protein